MGQYFHLLRIKEEHCIYFHLTFAGNKCDVKEWLSCNVQLFQGQNMPKKTNMPGYYLYLWKIKHTGIYYQSQAKALVLR